MCVHVAVCSFKFHCAAVFAIIGRINQLHHLNMGNSAAKEIAAEEAEQLKNQVTRKCNCFVVGVESTSVVVNVELTELKSELSALIQSYHNRPFRTEVGLLQMAKIITDIERHANYHKFAIWSMLQKLNECQTSFEELVSSKMNISKVDDMISDTAISNELRLRVETVVADYTSSIRDAGCWDELIELRSSQLERMLFKLGDSIIIQIKENIVNEFKNVAFEQIDEILCSEMCDGTFSDPESARSLLQSFVTVYAITRQGLEELPFLQRTQIELAQDKLSEYVEDLIRRVQMAYAYHFDETSMRMIMDLEESDTSSDKNSEDYSEDSFDDDNEKDNSDQVVEDPTPIVTKSVKKFTPKKAKAVTTTPTKTATEKKTPKKKASSTVANKDTTVSGKRKRKPSAKVSEGESEPTPAKRGRLTITTPKTTRKKAHK